MTFKIKASGGNRADNLNGIAKEIELMFDGIELGEEWSIVSPANIHKLRGYAQQLKIIAKELSAKNKCVLPKNFK